MDDVELMWMRARAPDPEQEDCSEMGRGGGQHLGYMRGVVEGHQEALLLASIIGGELRVDLLDERVHSLANVRLAPAIEQSD